MPTPLDMLLDPATHIMFAMFGGLALWEFIAPGRPLPRVRGWTLRALAAFTLYFLLSSILGMPPATATMTILIVTFLAMFQHANVRTPRWPGYLVQRPESHAVHHARGIHQHNYADLPVFDILFGTFRNPRTYEHDTGFWHGASSRVTDMLLLRDVSAPTR